MPPSRSATSSQLRQSRMVYQQTWLRMEERLLAWHENSQRNDEVDSKQTNIMLPGFDTQWMPFSHHNKNNACADNTSTTAQNFSMPLVSAPLLQLETIKPPSSAFVVGAVDAVITPNQTSLTQLETPPSSIDTKKACIPNFCCHDYSLFNYIKNHQACNHNNTKNKQENAILVDKHKNNPFLIAVGAAVAVATTTTQPQQQQAGGKWNEVYCYYCYNDGSGAVFTRKSKTSGNKKKHLTRKQQQQLLAKKQEEHDLICTINSSFNLPDLASLFRSNLNNHNKCSIF